MSALPIEPFEETLAKVASTPEGLVKLAHYERTLSWATMALANPAQREAAAHLMMSWQDSPDPLMKGIALHFLAQHRSTKLSELRKSKETEACEPAMRSSVGAPDDAEQAEADKWHRVHELHAGMAQTYDKMARAAKSKDERGKYRDAATDQATSAGLAQKARDGGKSGLMAAAMYHHGAAETAPDEDTRAFHNHMANVHLLQAGIADNPDASAVLIVGKRGLSQITGQ